MSVDEWRSVHVGLEDDGLTLGGVKVWQHVWRHTGERTLQLPHPDYPQQRHSFDIVEIGSLECPVRFAAGEISNGVWGFYIPA